MIARRRPPAKRDYVSMNTQRTKVENQPATWKAARNARRSRFGGWWLSGCLLLAVLFGGACGLVAPAETRARRRPAPSRPMEYISVGDRVVTQDHGERTRPTPTAVNPNTWKN